MLLITQEFLLPTMKSSYLLECYDELLRQIKSNDAVTKIKILDELSKNESYSYRIYTVTISRRDGNVTSKISAPIHTFHPLAKNLELKTIFQVSEFEEYIPLLKKHIDFTGETILFATDPVRENVFYVYEKCSISELNPKERFLLYCNKRLSDANQKIKLAMKEKVFNLESNLKIEHYIHKNQLAVETKLIALLKLINPETDKELDKYSGVYDKTDCLKCVYANLEKLLVFIEKEYNQYLNVNIMVPFRTVLMNEYAIKPKLEYVRSSLLAMEINPELVKILFEPLLLLSTINIQKKITYYQFNYATEYITELSQLIQESPSGVTEDELCKWLMDLNVNSFQFFDYETNRLKRDLNKCDTDFDQLDFLYKKLKKFNQHRSKINKSFNGKLPEIKEQICSWLEEEIEYINRIRNLNEGQTGALKPIEANNKILVGLSVAQLGYFVNILMHTGIIKHHNQREVFRMIADNFKTNGTDSISVDSLSSKYYNVESTTKSAIKEKIIELLNLSKK